MLLSFVVSLFICVALLCWRTRGCDVCGLFMHFVSIFDDAGKYQ